MLELYNNTNSVCAQKVRLAPTEKGLQAKEHMLKLQGDQFDPAYLPTLLEDDAAGAGYRIFQISDPETRRVQA